MQKVPEKLKRKIMVMKDLEGDLILSDLTPGV